MTGLERAGEGWRGAEATALPFSAPRPSPGVPPPYSSSTDQDQQLDAELRKGVQAALAAKAKGGSSTAYTK